MDQKLKSSNILPIKIANCIVVGGMIASGKSTLVNELSKDTNFIPIYELDDQNKDSLMYILLDHMYRRESISPAVCQLHFVLSRFEKYKNALKEIDDKTAVFDRSIFEDRLFAFYNLIDYPQVYTYYVNL